MTAPTLAPPPADTPLTAPPAPDQTKQRLLAGVLAAIIIIILLVILVRVAPSRPEPGEQAPAPTPSLDPITAVNAAFNTNDLASTIEQAQALVQQDSSDLRARLFLAAAWAQRGTVEYQEREYGDTAIALANQTLAQDATQAEAYRVIGYAQETRQDFAAAIAAYDQALALWPDNHVLLNNRGHAYDLAGDFPRAKADFERSLAVKPDYAPALQNMGRVRIRENDYPGARELFARVVDTGENQRLRAEALGGLSAIALYYDTDEDRALQLAEQAVAADPLFPYGYVAQARISVSRGQWEAAAEALEQALARYPALVAAHEWLGIAYAKAGQLDEAITAFQQGQAATANDIHLMANERAPLAARFDYYLAATYAAQEDTANAMAHLKQAVTGAGHDVVTMGIILATIQQGEQGFFASLAGLPEYDTLADALTGEALLATSGPALAPLSAHVASPWNFVAVAQARVVNLNPHGPLGLWFDEMITSYLRSYVHGDISFPRLQQLCQAATAQTSGGTQQCIIQGDLQTGITIGCTNVLIARYTPPQPPTARIQTQEACLGATVAADGSSSSDPDGSISSYAWSVSDPQGNAVTVAAAAPQITFAGAIEGNYGLSLTVRDDENLSHTATTSPRVYNSPPVAVMTIQGSVTHQPVQLDGSGSYDPDAEACGDTIRSYAWLVTDSAGNEIPVNNAAQPQAAFTPTQPDIYRVRLVVTDNHDKPGLATAPAHVGVPAFSPGPFHEIE